MKHGAGSCLLWPYSNNGNGYGKINYRGRLQYVHRLVCEKVNGPAPSKDALATHSCDNGHEGCCSPHHLAWGTPKSNMDERKTRGRSSFDRADLSVDQKNEIQRLKRSGHTVNELATMFGIRKSSAQWFGKYGASLHRGQ